jgi:hypothetical protein
MKKYKYLFIAILLLLSIFVFVIIKTSSKTYCLKNLDGYLQKIKFDMIYMANMKYIGYLKHKTLLSEEKHYKTLLRNISDPFSGKPYVYKLINDDEFLIYSIGPDCKDDGGVILKYNQNVGSMKEFEYLKKKDKRIQGDIVMRIKMPFSIEDFNKEWKEYYGTMYDSYFFDYSEVAEKAKGIFEMSKDLIQKYGIKPQNEKQDENILDGEDNSSTKNHK